MQWKIKEAVVPTKLENLFYLLLGAFVSLLGNLGFFTSFLAGESLYVSENLKQALSLYVQQFLNFFDNLAFAPASAVFIFWSIAGILTFSILQSLAGVASEVKQDITITTHYLHPKHYAKLAFVIEVLLQGLTHAVIYAIGIIAGVLVGAVLAPVAISLLQSLLVGFTFELLLIYFASLIVLWFGILLVATCVRLLLLRKRMYM